MADINAIVHGFAERLKSIDGLRSSDGEPDPANPPCAWAFFQSREPMTIDAGDQTMVFNVPVLVRAGTIREAQSQLFDYLSDEGPRSIEEALYAEPTLGGTITDILKISVEEGWGTYTIGNQAFPAGVIRVELMA